MVVSGTEDGVGVQVSINHRGESTLHPGRKLILQRKKLRLKEVGEPAYGCVLEGHENKLSLPELLWNHNRLKKWASLPVLGLVESAFREGTGPCGLNEPLSIFLQTTWKLLKSPA